MVRTRSASRALWRWPNTRGRNGRRSIDQRESVGMSGGHQARCLRPYTCRRLPAGTSMRSGRTAHAANRRRAARRYGSSFRHAAPRVRRRNWPPASGNVWPPPSRWPRFVATFGCRSVDLAGCLPEPASPSSGFQSVRCRLPCGHLDSTRNPASAYHSVKVTGAPCGKARSAAAFRAGLGSPNSRPAEAREPSRWLPEVCTANLAPSLVLRLSLPP